MPQYITCSKSGIDLERITDEGKYVLMHSYGICYECRWPFSVEELNTPEGMSEMSWPVKYVGYYCKECATNP